MKEEPTSTDTAKTGSSKKWIFWVVLILAVFAAFQLLPVDEWLKSLEVWIEKLGFWGPFVFILIYVLATVLLLPGAAMTPLAGLLFGLGWGTVWTIIASNIGANVAFVIGRYFARDFVSRKIKGNKKFGAIYGAVEREGLKIVGLTRLSPLFPFVLLNYAYGLTKVKWIHFAIASLFGMLPGTVMYVYFGSLGKLASESGEANTGKIALTILGLVATVVVTVVITRSAKKVLDQKIESES